MEYSVLRSTFEASDALALGAHVRQALIGGSYDCLLHPLGFYFIRLAQSERSSFRLHYWRPNDRDGSAITPYHDHVWHLRSCVLIGELENVLFDVQEDTSGDYTISQIRQVNGVDEVVPGTVRVSMHITSRKRHGRGEFYEVAPRSFHFT